MKSEIVSPYNGNDPYIFVSFSHRNQEETLEIVTRLTEDGYRVWYNKEAERIRWFSLLLSYFCVLLRPDQVRYF